MNNNAMYLIARFPKLEQIKIANLDKSVNPNFFIEGSDSAATMKSLQVEFIPGITTQFFEVAASNFVNLEYITSFLLIFTILGV